MLPFVAPVTLKTFLSWSDRLLTTYATIWGWHIAGIRNRESLMETVDLSEKMFVYSLPYGSEHLPDTLQPFYIVCIKPFEFKNKRWTKGLTDKRCAPGRWVIFLFMFWRAFNFQNGSCVLYICTMTRFIRIMNTRQHLYESSLIVFASLCQYRIFINISRERAKQILSTREKNWTNMRNFKITLSGLGFLFEGLFSPGLFICLCSG